MWLFQTGTDRSKRHRTPRMLLPRLRTPREDWIAWQIMTGMDGWTSHSAAARIRKVFRSPFHKAMGTLFCEPSQRSLLLGLSRPAAERSSDAFRIGPHEAKGTLKGPFTLCCELRCRDSRAPSLATPPAPSEPRPLSSYRMAAAGSHTRNVQTATHAAAVALHPSCSRHLGPSGGGQCLT